MKTLEQPAPCWILACTFAVALMAGSAAFAQAAGTYKMTTPIAPGVAVPDKVETSIGTLNLNYGYPDDATTRKVYDNLDAVACAAGLPAGHSDREPGRHARLAARVRTGTTRPTSSGKTWSIRKPWN